MTTGTPLKVGGLDLLLSGAFYRYIKDFPKKNFTNSLNEVLPLLLGGNFLVFSQISDSVWQ